MRCFYLQINECTVSISMSSVVRYLTVFQLFPTRFRRLLCLVEKLQLACYPNDSSSDDSDTNRADTATLTADKLYYLRTCRMVCCESVGAPSLCVSLLGNDHSSVHHRSLIGQTGDMHSLISNQVCWRRERLWI